MIYWIYIHIVSVNTHQLKHTHVTCSLRKCACMHFFLNQSAGQFKNLHLITLKVLSKIVARKPAASKVVWSHTIYIYRCIKYIINTASYTFNLHPLYLLYYIHMLMFITAHNTTRYRYMLHRNMQAQHKYVCMRDVDFRLYSRDFVFVFVTVVLMR